MAIIRKPLIFLGRTLMITPRYDFGINVPHPSSGNVIHPKNAGLTSVSRVGCVQNKVGNIQEPCREWCRPERVGLHAPKVRTLGRANNATLQAQAHYQYGRYTPCKKTGSLSGIPQGPGHAPCRALPLTTVVRTVARQGETPCSMKKIYLVQQTWSRAGRVQAAYRVKKPKKSSQGLEGGYMVVFFVP